MHRLLWVNILSEGVRAALLTIPFAQWFFKLKPVQDLILYLIDEYIVEPVFLLLVRFGVFTSIDWQNEATYRAYEKEAEKLIPLQDKEEWNEADRKKFRDSARSLIRFNLRS